MHGYFTCHACSSPIGRDPYESSLSQWIFDGGAYYRTPYTHARIPRDLFLSILVTGMWLKNHLFGLSLLVRVPRPEASTPCLDAAPSSAPLPTSLTRLFRSPTLTLVNARVRGPVGTQAPQSRAVNLFSEETMTSPYRPTGLLVTGRVQCTKVMLSCSCFKQRTRVLIRRLGLNVPCVSQDEDCASLAIFIFSLELSDFLSSQRSKLSFINNQRYGFFSIDCSLLLVCALVTA